MAKARSQEVLQKGSYAQATIEWTWSSWECLLLHKQNRLGVPSVARSNLTWKAATKQSKAEVEYYGRNTGRGICLLCAVQTFRQFIMTYTSHGYRLRHFSSKVKIVLWNWYITRWKKYRALSKRWFCLSA